MRVQHGALLLTFAAAAVQVQGLHLGEQSAAAASAGRFWGRKREPQEGVDCSEMPEVCASPFDCGPSVSPGSGFEHPRLEPGARLPAREGQQDRYVRLASIDGHANLHAWCQYPKGYLKYAQHCSKGEMVAAAHALHEVQSVRRPDGSYPLRTMDAAYCFASGHCNDTAVTANTTLDEAETMCDKKYSRRIWASVGPLEMAKSPTRLGRDSSWGKVACSMGTFHCDVMYCKEFYCHDAKWISKFGALAQGPERTGRL